MSIASSSGATRVGERAASLPRLGFAGAGWIGLARMRALAAAGVAEPAAIADPAPDARAQALAVAAGLEQSDSFEDLLSLDLDGIVIATPSALHAEQATAALERGLAVFCQKPLGRDGAEARRVVEAARHADRLLAVDLAYRHTEALRRVEEALRQGSLGRPYALDLTFHNAYGPDKPWFTDRRLAGGGCLLDLGTHLVDLALWLTAAREVRVTSSHVLRAGLPLRPEGREVEDHVIAELELGGGMIARIACSWWLPAGRDCVFEATVLGTEAAASVANVGGSFYDFRAALHHGTSSTVLAEPPDAWGGRAVVSWARRLSEDRGFDPAAEELVQLAEVLDAIYEAAG